jgi:hypothetical protein
MNNHSSSTDAIPSALSIEKSLSIKALSYSQKLPAIVVLKKVGDILPLGFVNVVIS